MASTRFAALRQADTQPGEDENTPPSPETPDEIPPAPNEDDGEDEKEPEAMNDKTTPVASEDTPEYKAGFAANQDRIKAVAASEHFQGRERKAMQFLATSMAADEIIGMLAEEPKADTKADAEEAGREAMKAALEANKNPDLEGEGEGGDEPDAAAKADAIWDRAAKANAPATAAHKE